MIYSISDLHLSASGDKPMAVFGEEWAGHEKRIMDYWLENITHQDLVLIPGDISWGMTLAEALPDLEWIDGLPGQKVFVKGNHDYWWSGITKLNQLSESMFFIQNHFYGHGNTAICGSRGWVSPNSPGYTGDDERIYMREAGRLKASLEAAKNAGYEKMIGMMHYPPAGPGYESTLFTDLFETFKVSRVVYGHLHGSDSYSIGWKGTYHPVHYQLVSCDYLKFRPIQLEDTR